MSLPSTSREPARPLESPPALRRAHPPFREPACPPPSPPAPLHPAQPPAHPGPLYGGWPASHHLATPLTLVPPSTLAACLPSVLAAHPLSTHVCPPLYSQPACWAAECVPRASGQQPVASRLPVPTGAPSVQGYAYDVSLELSDASSMPQDMPTLMGMSLAQSWRVPTPMASQACPMVCPAHGHSSMCVPALTAPQGTHGA